MSKIPFTGPAPPPLPGAAPLTYAAELRRKALHLGALALPVGLLVLGRERALVALVPLAVVAVGLDVARQRVPAVRRAIVGAFGPIMRPEELPEAGGPLVLNGAVWMCLSAAVCAAVFPEPVAAAALTMQMLGDGAAAVVGRRWGRVRYPWSSKSLEGSAALFATALVGAWALAQLPLPGLAGALPLGRLAAGALAAAVAEALPIPPNDNLRVPVAAALAMFFV